MPVKLWNTFKSFSFLFFFFFGVLRWIGECHVHTLNKLFYRVKVVHCIHLNSNLMRHIFSNRFRIAKFWLRISQMHALPYAPLPDRKRFWGYNTETKYHYKHIENKCVIIVFRRYEKEREIMKLHMWATRLTHMRSHSFE